ncbi:MAG: precorrin-6y C5,15-methyltransferase (decarboxylating) subunit CbiE [Bacteroidaceae bacterium]|nr:precorrin-6y C5,15-methyltransferase (decarboxylating) subunit CbiE [Bacteroidaceae bacterium]
MKFYVIGITDHPQPWFPPEVEELICHGRIFSGGRRHHDIMASRLPKGAVWIDIAVPLDAVFEQYQTHHEIIVFASGDPLFFGFANTLQRRLPEAELQVFPAPNSLQMLAYRCLIPYDDMHIVSLTGRPWHELDRALMEHTAKIGVLTDRQHTPTTIAQRLMDYGYTDYTMWVGEHLGNPQQERVVSLSLKEAAAATFDLPNCLILWSKHPLPPRRMGIPDAEFELLDGRERMITKMPIRLLSLQALELPRRTVFWDVGFCTGSVSIEAALQFPHLHIHSFEVREEGRRLMDVNSRRFGAVGIEVSIGDFLDKDLSALPRPDAVFIGGHGGRLKEMMAKISKVLTVGGCIVMNSVTEQSRHDFETACDALHLQFHAPVHVALNDYNPIDILKAEKTTSKCLA